MKNFIKDQYNITNKAIDSVTSFFKVKRYGIKGCKPDECLNYNLIKYELLRWQIDKGENTEEPPVNLEYIFWGYFDLDPFNEISINGTNNFQFSKVYINNNSIYQNLDFTYPASNKYLVLKEPIDASIKTQWNNTSFNYGIIPDQVFRYPVVHNGFRYYISRVPVFLPIGDTKISFQ